MPYTFNLKLIGSYLETRNLWDTPFRQWSQEEILGLGQAFVTAFGNHRVRDIRDHIGQDKFMKILKILGVAQHHSEPGGPVYILRAFDDAFRWAAYQGGLQTPPKEDPHHVLPGMPL